MTRLKFQGLVPYPPEDRVDDWGLTPEQQVGAGVAAAGLPAPGRARAAAAAAAAPGRCRGTSQWRSHRAHLLAGSRAWTASPAFP
jgi:hypothetical protein